MKFKKILNEIQKISNEIKSITNIFLTSIFGSYKHKATVVLSKFSDWAIKFTTKKYKRKKKKSVEKINVKTKKSNDKKFFLIM